MAQAIACVGAARSGDSAGETSFAYSHVGCHAMGATSTLVLGLADISLHFRWPELDRSGAAGAIVPALCGRAVSVHP